MLEIYGVRNNVSTTYYPQASWRFELSNREIKQIMEKTVNANRMIYEGGLIMLFEPTGLHTKHQLVCLHTNLYMGRIVTWWSS